MTRLLLNSRQSSIDDYEKSIIEAIKANDYETAEVLLSFFQVMFSPMISEEAFHLIYPERHLESIISRWEIYQESQPISTPVLLEKLVLMWQLGDMLGVSRVVNEALEIDPYNHDAQMVMKYMQEFKRNELTP